MSKIDMPRAEDVCILSWNYSESELELFINCCLLCIFEELLGVWDICSMDRGRTLENFYWHISAKTIWKIYYSPPRNIMLKTKHLN